MHRARAILLIMAAISVGSACGSGGSAAPKLADPGAASIVRIVDGDTLVVHFASGGDDEKVRLIGIDTPETHGRGGLKECFGKEATDHLARLLPIDTAVRVVRDVEARDRYGRLLAYLYRSSDGLFVNQAMAADGYADLLTYPPNVAHTEDFRKAVARARERDVGLWKACGNADKAI
ncbi:MAG TPA: thermonuclease family protein [Acidimicrobiales bacterium]|nr:thermonuclease family protein [Acidimicrobiales bacterium]